MKQFFLFIDGQKYDWNNKQITGLEVRSLGSINNETGIFRKVRGEELEVQDDDVIELAPGAEHFYTRKKEHLVTITVKVDEKTNIVKISKGIHSVSEIKEKGEVPSAYQLEQQTSEGLIPLADNGSVDIKGGEVFIGHVRDGASS